MCFSHIYISRLKQSSKAPWHQGKSCRGNHSSHFHLQVLQASSFLSSLSTTRKLSIRKTFQLLVLPSVAHSARVACSLPTVHIHSLTLTSFLRASTTSRCFLILIYDGDDWTTIFWLGGQEWSAMNDVAEFFKKEYVGGGVCIYMQPYCKYVCDEILAL